MGKCHDYNRTYLSHLDITCFRINVDALYPEPDFRPGPDSRCKLASRPKTTCTLGSANETSPC